MGDWQLPQKTDVPTITLKLQQSQEQAMEDVLAAPHAYNCVFVYKM